ncbi:MAG: magnesium transporter, partial [Corynebacterium sp.]|nr:magnesium transporter [Corynebacterium sp.]
GCVHLQKLLREPPSSLVGGILDLELPALHPEDTEETAARYFATYNLVSAPVLDEDSHLLGVVGGDDLLDHLLPENWRDDDWRSNRRAATTTPSA